eukprot:89487-Pleurochrysis_carterae.AAC.1
MWRVRVRDGVRARARRRACACATARAWVQVCARPRYVRTLGWACARGAVRRARGYANMYTDALRRVRWRCPPAPSPPLRQKPLRQALSPRF